jgi:hypothetical protein
MPTYVAARVLMLVSPVLAMIALIPFVQNDFALVGIYVVIIAVSAIRYTRKDLAFLIFGFFMLLGCEYLFLLTGVETFVRHTLFGVMPLWLPFLWAYIFVQLRRSALVFENYLR